MSALILLWWWTWASIAQAVTGDICVDVDVDFPDKAGDRWLDDGVDRVARGVRIKVYDQGIGGYTLHWLSESDGCLRNHAVVGPAIWVSVFSIANVSGVDLRSWRGASDLTRPIEEEVFYEASVPANYSYTFTHEIGHVILFHRAGGQEPNDAGAPMNQCNGSYTTGGVQVPQNEYGFLTKEFLSVVFKEGWADFMAVHTWNDPSTSGCDLQNPTRDHDLDLDGDTWMPELGPSLRGLYPGSYRTTDGVNVPTSKLIGVLDCDGDPDVEGIQGGPSVPWGWSPPYTVNGRNWLGDLIAANDPEGCVAASNADHEENRSTRYDFVRMLWAMRTDQGLGPNQLSNLMTDTCFRTWDADDASSPTDAHLPFLRLEASAAALPQAVEDALDAESDHVLH